MAITKRGDKGSALTYDELDENFRWLEDDLTLSKIYENDEEDFVNTILESNTQLQSTTKPRYIFSGTYDVENNPALANGDYINANDWDEWYFQPLPFNADIIDRDSPPLQKNGSMYDTNTGIFTCTSNGQYMFDFTLHYYGAAHPYVQSVITGPPAANPQYKLVNLYAQYANGTTKNINYVKEEYLAGETSTDKQNQMRGSVILDLKNDDEISLRLVGGVYKSEGWTRGSTLNIVQLSSSVSVDEETANLEVTGTLTANTISATGDITANSLSVTNYRPGELIETITGNCRGEAIEGISGTYTLENVTAGQTGTTTYTAVTGSTINYTPPPGTKRVLYRFDYKFDVTENSGISHHVLNIDGVQVEPSTTTISSNYASTNWHHANFMITFSYVIQCDAASDNAAEGQFTSWTSPKELKIMYREYSGSYESSLHTNTWWDGTGATGDDIFRSPTLTIQSFA